ncbi:MAG: NADH-quinone oxidoreductase subunit H [Deltaproteobacteria bacterium]|nr:NADH-quinone oxidoreductase subunit H [Deltaproteobacteria bacterium]
MTGIIFAVLTVLGAIPFLWLARALTKARAAARAAIDRAAIPPRNEATGHPVFRGVLKLSLDGTIAFSWLAGLGLAVLTVLQFTAPFDAQVQEITGVAWPAIRQPMALNGLQLGIFTTKTLAVVFVIIQLRWTLPRVRVDQMMALCWKYLVPLSLVCMIGTVAWELVVYSFSLLGLIMRLFMTVVAAFVVFRYVVKTRRNYLADKENFEVWRDETPWYPPWKLV